jgi:hypothetical protein
MNDGSQTTVSAALSRCCADSDPNTRKFACFAGQYLSHVMYRFGDAFILITLFMCFS